MIQINPAVEVFQKILKVYETIQTQYQNWINYGPNTGTGFQYAPRFEIIITTVEQAKSSCKDYLRKNLQKYDQLDGLIQLMDEILIALYSKKSYFYGFGEQTATGTQMATHIKQTRDKAGDLSNRSLILMTFQADKEQGGEVKQVEHYKYPQTHGLQTETPTEQMEEENKFQHLKCPKNHWFQLEDLYSFTCSRKGCGTTYYDQNYVRVCRKCKFIVCENCVHHKQI